MAEHGTIFLDEVAELPLSLQPKLLRVLQERVFEPLGSSRSIKADVRIIAATNKNLEAEVREGRFREDLYWRLNVVPIVLPALRERKKDIPLLVGYYLKKFSDTYKKRITLSEDTMNAFLSYQWPGNVRELANTIERLVIMAEKDTIECTELPLYMTSEGSPIVPIEETGLIGEVEAIERSRIINALRKNGMVKKAAAKALGITVRQLGYKIKKYSLDTSKV
jgi:Nif-specific regulatory protein